MQNDAAQHLHPVGAHTQHPVRSLPHGGKGLRQEIVFGFPVFQPLPELRRLGLELFIRQGAVFRLQCHDVIHGFFEFFQLGFVAAPQEILQKIQHLFLLHRPSENGQSITGQYTTEGPAGASFPLNSRPFSFPVLHAIMRKKNPKEKTG